MSSPRFGRASVGTAIVLMAVGGVIAFAVDIPAQIEEYVDVLDLGLILIWAGVLLLVMQVVIHRPRGPKRPPGGSASTTTARTSGTRTTCTVPATPARPGGCRRSASGSRTQSASASRRSFANA